MTTPPTEDTGYTRHAAQSFAHLHAALAERVGLPEGTATSVLMETLDRRLAEQTGPPDGTELVDSPTLATLREEAEAGRTYRTREVLAQAIREGKMRVADRPRWERALAADFDNTAALIKTLPVVVPVAPKGYSVDPEHDEAADLIANLYGGA